MRWVVLLAIAWCPPARADDGSHQQAVALVQAAHDAAVAGNCTTARKLADQARELDDAYYQVAVAPDRTITDCVQTAAPLPVAPPPPRLPEPREPIPPLGGRLVLEVLGGYSASLLGLAAGAFITAAIHYEGCGDVCIPDNVLIGAYAGGVVMLSLGVYAIGSFGNQRGSFGSTMAGGLIGGSAAMMITLAVAHDGDIAEGAGGLIATSLLLAPMVGAMVGFNRTRAWDGPAGSLVQVQAGRLSLGVPLVTRSESHGRAITTLPLIGGRF